MAVVPEPVPGDPPERPARETVGVIDPRARALLEWLKLIGAPRLHTRSIAQARRELRVTIAISSYVETVERVQALTIPGPTGPLAARVYRPRRSRGPLPVLVWFHGGGFVLGGLDTADPTCRALANRTGALVVSVAYRLAPEHAPPTAVEDWTRFARLFVGEGPLTPLALAVNGFFQNGGSRCYILDVGPGGRQPGLLAAARPRAARSLEAGALASRGCPAIHRRRDLRHLHELRQPDRSRAARGHPVGAPLHRLRAQRTIGDEVFHRLEEELDWSELDASPPGRFQPLMG